VSSGKIFGTTNNYRIDSSWHTLLFWHPMPTPVKFNYNRMKIKMVIS